MVKLHNFQGLTSHTAITIAHEIALTLGVDHDDVNDFRCNKTYFVMSPRVGEVTPRTRTKWSTCSKEKMASILKSSKAICLRRQLQKQESNVTTTKDDSQFMLSSNPLPGVIFEPDRQCQILFDRPDSYVCNQEAQDNKFCQKLWLIN